MTPYSLIVRNLLPGGKVWRRERDSNPRRAFDPYTLSRGAPSTTRPSLRLEAVKAGLSITYKLDEPRTPSLGAGNETGGGRKGKAGSRGWGCGRLRGPRKLARADCATGNSDGG